VGQCTFEQPKGRKRYRFFAFRPSFKRSGAAFFIALARRRMNDGFLGQLQARARQRDEALTIVRW
jgi:hypothetical protein